MTLSLEVFLKSVDVSHWTLERPVLTKMFSIIVNMVFVETYASSDEDMRDELFLWYAHAHLTWVARIA